MTFERYDKPRVSDVYCSMLYFNNNSLKAFSSADSFTSFSAPSIRAVAWFLSSKNLCA